MFVVFFFQVYIAYVATVKGYVIKGYTIIKII